MYSHITIMKDMPHSIPSYIQKKMFTKSHCVLLSVANNQKLSTHTKKEKQKARMVGNNQTQKVQKVSWSTVSKFNK